MSYCCDVECTINLQNLMKIVGAIFEKMKILYSLHIFFLLCELPLMFRVERKQKIVGYMYKGTPDTEFEQDWSVGLDATLGDAQNIKNYFSSFWDFFGIDDSVILLEFECSINPQNLIKIVGAIFEKI